MVSDQEERLLDEIDAIVKKLRQIWLAKKRKEYRPTGRQQYPQFEVGDRVLVLSTDHYHKEATILRIRGEQQWWVRLDNGTEFYRKFSMLRKIQRPADEIE